MDGWLAKAEFSKCLGFSTQNFDQALRPKLPDDAMKQDGRRLLVHWPTAARIYFLHVQKAAMIDPGAKDDPEAVLAETLAKHPEYIKERIRREKALADQEEMSRDEKRRNLLPKPQVHECLARLSSLLKGCGQTLQQHHGPDALRILNETIDDFEREVRNARELAE
jgi:hypothetical protein